MLGSPSASGSTSRHSSARVARSPLSIPCISCSSSSSTLGLCFVLRADVPANWSLSLTVWLLLSSSGQSSCRAPGLWTAVPPLLSLFTSYWGSSALARTFRPAASVSFVIFRWTVPSAVLPWLFQVTWSPLLSSSLMTPPPSACASPCPAEPASTHPAADQPNGNGTHPCVQLQDAVRHVASSSTGKRTPSALLQRLRRLPMVMAEPRPRSPARSTPFPRGRPGRPVPGPPRPF